MKNNITLLITLVSIALLIYVGLEGIKIGDFEVLSISQLIEKNKDLDKKIKEARILTSTNYPDTIETLEETYEGYRIKKQKYEELVGTTTATNEAIYETKQYDIGYLWERIGIYATLYNLKIDMSVQNGETSNLYNLNFSIIGQYTNVSQFINSIENNSDFNFRIYNFKMEGQQQKVKASFVVKKVNIDPSTLVNVASNINTEKIE